jgi:hypothetical protein
MTPSLKQIEELIGRLEKASGPSAGLDNEIYWLFSDWKNVGGGWREHKKTGKRETYSFPVYPSYTSSIDAALTLVPEGEPYRMGTCNGSCAAQVGTDMDFCDGATIAIALCIASLRARLAILSKEEA